MDAVSAIEVHTEALSGASQRVIRLEAREETFALYEVKVALLIDVAPLSRDLIGRSASVHLTTTLGRERFWHGIVWSVRARPRAQNDVLLELSIAPRTCALSLGRDSRIFRNQNVPAVVEDVLRRGGIEGAARAWHLTEALPTHDNIVQYGESDYAFVRRILAEEGLAFAIQNGAEEERIVFFDSPRGAEPAEVIDTLQYSPTSVRNLESVFDVEEGHCVVPRRAALRDWDVRRSDIPRRAGAGTDRSREVYLHPGGFAEESDGNRRAARYLEALRSRRRTIRARSDVPWLEPGRLFRIEGHDRVELNEQFFLLSVAHRCERGEDAGDVFAFENELEAIPAPTPYRPDPRPWRPRAIGLQSAFVTVPGPLEHHSDDLGRFKVRFPWDRSGILDAESSTWCRVGQQQLPGPMLLPRVAFEVDVACEHGDPDRHLITGHRYNAEQPPPYPLPSAGAITSWQSRTLYGGLGANEVRFDDSAGREEMYFHASLHQRGIVEHDAVRRVANHENVIVGIRQSLTVTRDFVSVVGLDRTVAVGRNQGLRVDESYSDAVGQDERVTCNRRRLKTGGDLTENVRRDRTCTVGPIRVVGVFGDYAHRTVRDSTTTVGALWAERVSGDRVSRVRGDRTETVAALKLIEVGSFRASGGSGIDETYSSLTVEVGGARSDAADSNARWRATGELRSTAPNISVTATSSLTIAAGACTITLASSGTVTLHGPRVNLRNAQAIGSQVRVN
jgi:type VI secretion system secreted protein VgrG